MNFLQKKSMIIKTHNNNFENLNFYDFKKTHEFYDELWKKMYDIKIAKSKIKNIDKIFNLI